jgi:hypothetical protein
VVVMVVMLTSELVAAGEDGGHGMLNPGSLCCLRPAVAVQRPVARGVGHMQTRQHRQHPELWQGPVLAKREKNVSALLHAVSDHRWQASSGQRHAA